jgi:hypothetical protein
MTMASALREILVGAIERILDLSGVPKLRLRGGLATLFLDTRAKRLKSQPWPGPVPGAGRAPGGQAVRHCAGQGAVVARRQARARQQ